MAQTPVKRVVKPKVVKEQVVGCDCDKKFEKLYEEIAELNYKIATLEANIDVKKGPSGRSIHKVEDFNREVATPPEEYSMILKMSHAEKIQSATNACKILPPNLLVDGRHTAENVGAICGFIVDEEMLDEIYATLVHEVY